ncbi:acyl-CoA thioester hydrolase/BAAT C-terminal domain-containing protein [Edaphobacter sp.]|uniref:acyl-CoA thioester hydrolase/BAAT C-terminal domain-containing protein n=1 Tax=Edaphobacter sp. TaxID=1934404 RepID=UPI002DBACB33|nr:acyl-CoA thioester hydrolase/BAAT C-terminal domain-containing protein [Edaphobacter sp.]HEU5341193.1 acyl-CoA thioester hydrolase/BAAT C-terminal domain-containing protein [Edaphobacter sp.]
MRRLQGLLIGFLFYTSVVVAQSLEITPARVMADEAATIRVTGLAPQEHIVIQAELTDGGGQPWASRAEFAADASGVVDATKQAPVKGSYDGVSAMGLVWAMMPATKNVQIYQPPHQLGVQAIDFRVMADGKQIANGQLEQMALRDGVKQIRLTGALHGVFLVPDAEGKHPGVLMVGGSEGGVPVRKAAWLASHGYAVLALAYFRYDDLPRELENIPLEYFGEALSWIMQRPEVEANELAVVGTSRGGELALQLGSMYPQVRAVVAYVPANVRYPACCNRMRGAAWTWKGQPVAYVLPRFKGDAALAAAATIRVEQTHGPILVISGGSDGVWDSRSMADAVVHRLQEAHFAYPYEHLNYPHAGHRAGSPEIIPAWSGAISHPVSGEEMNLGGTAKGNAESTLDAGPKVLEFLERSFAASAAR